MFQESIDRQLEYNQGKNLFYKGIIHSLKFSPETIETISRIHELDMESENRLLEYLTNRIIQEFCKTNQYYTFDKHAREGLREIYAGLVADIKSGKSPVDSVSKDHYKKLIRWLLESNPFAAKIYGTEDETVESVVCSEYSTELQLEILQLDISLIVEPVLDIGCGKKGSLVLYLRQNGIKAFGFDRFAVDNLYLANSDWFGFEFEEGKWGTIISNLGFSNHFKHHHFRKDGNFIGYAQKYMDILGSLKIGGSFFYAPGLPFVEQYLDEDKYQLAKQNIGGYDFESIKIKRLK